MRIASWSRDSDADSSDPASRLPSSITVRMCSAASPAPPSARSPHRPRSVSVRTATGSGIGSPASAGTPRASLAATYLPGQRQTRQPAALERLAKRDHALDQLPLKVDRAVELRAVGHDGRPSGLGDRVELGARGGGYQDVGHVIGAQRLQPCDGRAVYQSRSCYTVE